MKWILFTGTWRLTNSEVEADVRKAAREVLDRGDAIVTGGATGVDFFAMDEALKMNPNASHLRVIIPTSLENYIKDYQDNWCLAPITTEHIAELAKVLTKIKETNPVSIMELPYTDISQDEYDLRHDQEVLYSHEVFAFQVNESTGTQDTIDKAKAAGLPITLHKKYTI